MQKTLPETLNRWAEISIQRSMYEFGHFLRSRGISMPQIMLMMHLLHTGPRTVSDISRHMDISNPAASQLIQRLVEQDFVDRREGTEDRRVKEIHLTAHGRSMIRSAIEARSTWIENLAERLPEQHRLEIESALTFLIQAAQEGAYPHDSQEDPS